MSGGTLTGTLSITGNGNTYVKNGLIVSKDGSLSPITVNGGVSGNLEASIIYQHPDDSTQKWAVGMGCNGLGSDYFCFYNYPIGGEVFYIRNDGSAKVSKSFYVGNNVTIWNDNEGGNIQLTGNEGTKWSIDALNGTFRFILNESSVPFTFYGDGSISTNNGNVITSSNLSLSGTTLTITTN